MRTGTECLFSLVSCARGQFRCSREVMRENSRMFGEAGLGTPMRMGPISARDIATLSAPIKNTFSMGFPTSSP